MLKTGLVWPPFKINKKINFFKKTVICNVTKITYDYIILFLKYLKLLIISVVTFLFIMSILDIESVTQNVMNKYLNRSKQVHHMVKDCID